MVAVDFKCTNCGDCCREQNLVEPRFGWEFGLYLSPDETLQFPPESVKPLFGVGFPVVTTAYQMVTRPCPNYGDGACLVYNKRPLVCRSFPAIYVQGGVSASCRFVRELPAGDCVSVESIKNEIEAEKKKWDMAQVQNDWIWPANVGRWIAIPGGRFYDRHQTVQPSA
jgi:Fe-S-cluster containining protein